MNSFQPLENNMKTDLPDPISINMKWMPRNANQTLSGVAALPSESGPYQDVCADLKSLEGKVSLLYFISK